VGSPREEGLVSVIEVFWSRTSVCSLLSMSAPIVSAHGEHIRHDPCLLTHTTQKASPHPGHLTSLAMSATCALPVIPATLSIVARSHPCTGHLVCLDHTAVLGPAEVNALLVAGHACVRI
jgi:hypothetical protein